MRLARLALVPVLGLAIATLAATSSLASAQPSLVAPMPPPAAPVDTYVEPGVSFGVTRGGFYGAYELDGGYHLKDSSLWAHGRIATGGMAGIDEATMSSNFFEARAGVERHGCVAGGAVCVIGGVDLGIRHTALSADDDQVDAVTVVVVPRVALDLGSEHWRFRQSLELSLDLDGTNGVGLTTGIAYVW